MCVSVSVWFKRKDIISELCKNQSKLNLLEFVISLGSWTQLSCKGAALVKSEVNGLRFIAPFTFEGKVFFLRFHLLVRN